MYIPPFTVSAEAINLIAEISGQVEPIIASTNAGQSGPFIDFMLNEIYKTLKSHQGEPLHDKVADKVANKSAQKVLLLLYENGHLTRDELSQRTGLSFRPSFA